MKFEPMGGPELTDLANATSTMVVIARDDRGMEIDVIVSVIATTITDYARAAYGDEYVEQLCELMRKRLSDPLPEMEYTQ